MLFCSHSHSPPSAPRRKERFSSATPTWTAGQDHDSIHVGKHDGRFRAIQLRVEGGEVFFENVVVHFHDGSHEELIVRDRIPSGGSTRAIDLPGNRRVIESVELWYGKARWEHRPKVALFGLR